MDQREHGLVTAIDFLVQGGDQMQRGLAQSQGELAATKVALAAETKAHADTKTFLASANAQLAALASAPRPVAHPAESRELDRTDVPELEDRKG
jgi:hypothetical protein